MLKDYVLQTTNAPGTAATINLDTAAVAGRRKYTSAFSTGATVYYFLDDGTQFEDGYGTFTSGTPDTLTRTVITNSSGTTSRLNFNLSGTKVYCSLPASKAVYMDNSNNAVITGSLTVGTGGSFLASLSANGYQKLPSGIIIQWGNATTGGGGGVTVTFPISFPTAVYSAVTAVINAGAAPTVILASVNVVASGFGVGSSDSATQAFVPGASFYWMAIGR